MRFRAHDSSAEAQSTLSASGASASTQGSGGQRSSFSQDLHVFEHLGEAGAAVLDVLVPCGIIREMAVIEHQGVAQAGGFVCERGCLDCAVIQVVGHAFANGLSVGVAVLRFSY